MYIDNVKVTDTVHLGDNNYKKIECSVNLSQGESANEAEIMASGFIEDAFRRKYPSLFPESKKLNKEMVDNIKFLEKPDLNYFDYIPTDQRPGNDLATSSPEFIKMQMETCKSVPVLKIYKKDVDKYPELETVYNQKLNELSK